MLFSFYEAKNKIQSAKDNDKINKWQEKVYNVLDSSNLVYQSYAVLVYGHEADATKWTWQIRKIQDTDMSWLRFSYKLICT